MLLRRPRVEQNVQGLQDVRKLHIAALLVLLALVLRVEGR